MRTLLICIISILCGSCHLLPPLENEEALVSNVKRFIEEHELQGSCTICIHYDLEELENL